MNRSGFTLIEILLATMMCQGRISFRTGKHLKAHLGVSKKTLLRWVSFFKEGFLRTVQWQRARSFVGAGVHDDDLPRGVLVHFWRRFGSGEPGLLRCLCFLAVGRAEVHGV